MGDITKYFTKHTSMSDIKVKRLPKCEQDIANLLEVSDNNPKLIMDASLTDYERGILYFFGLGELRDEDNGLSYLRSAADEGNIDAMNLYAYACYHTSRHCGDDMALIRMYENDCLQYLMKAKKNGQPEGIFNLGICYFEGKLVPANEEKGLELIKQAAALGNEVAKEYLHRLEILLKPNAGVERELEPLAAIEAISRRLWQELESELIGVRTSVAGLYNDIYSDMGYKWIKKEGYTSWLSSKDDGSTFLIEEQELERVGKAMIKLGEARGYRYKADGSYGIWLKN